MAVRSKGQSHTFLHFDICSYNYALIVVAALFTAHASKQNTVLMAASFSVIRIMPRLHVKYNYFKIISAFVDVRLK